MLSFSGRNYHLMRCLMCSRRTVLMCCLVPISTAVLAGCSDQYGGRMEVTGGVTLQGQPVKDGSVIFVPLDKQETQGGAQVINGEYRIPAQHGLKPGKY